MLTERFDRAVSLEQSVCEDWRSWFEPDYQEPESVQEWERTGFASDIFEEMLESGLHHWTNLQWVNCVLDVLPEWKNLIKVRLFAQELLRSVPGEYPQVREFLLLLSQGDFCRAMPGKASFYPADSEYYLRSLKWEMVPLARDSEADFTSNAKARVVSKYR